MIARSPDLNVGVRSVERLLGVIQTRPASHDSYQEVVILAEDASYWHTKRRFFTRLASWRAESHTWAHYSGRYDQTWEEARSDFATRAGLV
jgi:hypothetical protein